MPSYARQGLRIIKRKKPKNNGSYILIARKTGFVDVWIGNKHYYYNSKETNIEKIIEDADAKEQKKKGVIVIRRK